MILTLLCIMLILASAAISFISSTWGTPLAFLAVCTAGLLPGIHISTTGYIFWGIAMVIVVALGFVLPRTVSESRRGLPYIAGGALAGALTGLAIGATAAVIIGALAGAVLGGVAYGRTPGGKILEFPTKRFFNYLCAKGLPSAVAMSMNGLAAGLLASAGAL